MNLEQLGEYINRSLVEIDDELERLSDKGKEISKDIDKTTKGQPSGKKANWVEVSLALVNMVASAITIYEFLTSRVEPEVHETYQSTFKILENLKNLLEKMGVPYKDTSAPKLNNRLDDANEWMNDTDKEIDEGFAQPVRNFFSNAWEKLTGLFGRSSEADKMSYPLSPSLFQREFDKPENLSEYKGDPDKSPYPFGIEFGSFIDEKWKTFVNNFDNFALNADKLFSNFPLVTEAQADELTDADKGKTASDEGKTSDTAAILDELKLLKESFAAQIASGRAALSEARDQVIFAREAVTTLQTKVATLSVVVNNLKLPKSEEPKINEYVEYQLDSTYKRI